MEEASCDCDAAGDAVPRKHVHIHCMRTKGPTSSPSGTATAVCMTWCSFGIKVSGIGAPASALPQCQAGKGAGLTGFTRATVQGCFDASDFESKHSDTWSCCMLCPGATSNQRKRDPDTLHSAHLSIKNDTSRMHWDRSDRPE